MVERCRDTLLRNGIGKLYFCRVHVVAAETSPEQFHEKFDFVNIVLLFLLFFKVWDGPRHSRLLFCCRFSIIEDLSNYMKHRNT